MNPREILERAGAEHGKREIFSMIMSARIGYGIQGIFEALNITPPPDLQQRCADIMWSAMFKLSLDDLMVWCNDVESWNERQVR